VTRKEKKRKEKKRKEGEKKKKRKERIFLVDWESLGNFANVDSLQMAKFG